jgi:hypothetical protein
MEKPVEQIVPVAIDFVGLRDGDQGNVIIGFVLPGRVDVEIELTPAILASLEAKLAAVRREMARRHKPQ